MNAKEDGLDLDSNRSGGLSGFADGDREIH
jgi:hypothetical protein